MNYKKLYEKLISFDENSLRFIVILLILPSFYFSYSLIISTAISIAALIISILLILVSAMYKKISPTVNTAPFILLFFALILLLISFFAKSAETIGFSAICLAIFLYSRSNDLTLKKSLINILKSLGVFALVLTVFSLIREVLYSGKLLEYFLGDKIKLINISLGEAARSPSFVFIILALIALIYTLFFSKRPLKIQKINIKAIISIFMLSALTVLLTYIFNTFVLYKVRLAFIAPISIFVLSALLIYLLSLIINSDVNCLVYLSASLSYILLSYQYTLAKTLITIVFYFIISIFTVFLYNALLEKYKEKGRYTSVIVLISLGLFTYLLNEILILI